VVGPFGCPWVTFGAFVSVAVAAIVAIVWALLVKLED